MASVFKPKGTKKYVILYTDESGRRRKKVGAADKGVTQRIARDLENRVALRREGLVDPKDEAFAKNEGRPIAAHLDDFEAMLRAKNGPGKHASVTANRTRRVLELAKARRISEINHSATIEALGAIRDGGLGQETINHHIRAVKGFARWLWKDGRAREHRLAHLATSSPEADRRRIRRALTPAEASRLVEAAERGRPAMGMSGADRARCYLLALGTGFRAEELASLTPERFDLAAAHPTATVPAGYTKNGRLAVQPIPPALARRLAPWLAGLPAGRPIFEMPDRTADMIRADLEAAGIPYETESGVADFHALRAAYISNLVASGASVKTCQVLARHSTPSLTIGIYAKATIHDLAGAVASLPDPSNPGPDLARMKATGTGGLPSPPATGIATGPDQAETQESGTEGGYAILSLDLKSSGGEPPCGFKSHRRQSATATDSGRLVTPGSLVFTELRTSCGPPR